MKKAEIIKNGNINLKPIKTGIDWDKILYDFHGSQMYFKVIEGKADSVQLVEWFKKRIEKELQASGSNP